MSKKNIDVNKKDWEGFTPLHIVLQEGHFEVAGFLLRHKDIKVDEKNNYGVTPAQVPCDYNSDCCRVYTLFKNTMVSNGRGKRAVEDSEESNEEKESTDKRLRKP